MSSFVCYVQGVIKFTGSIDHAKGEFLWPLQRWNGQLEVRATFEQQPAAGSGDTATAEKIYLRMRVLWAAGAAVSAQVGSRSSRKSEAR